MAGVKFRRRGGLVLRLCLCFSLMACLMVELGVANVVLIANNESLSFEDVEANFAPSIKGSGVKGVVYAAEPLDACTQFTKKAAEGSVSPFALIIRGGCTFDEKVRHAQDAGYKGAIVYDNEDSGVLIQMAGTSSDIQIYAVFVSKASGELLKKYSGRSDVEVWIIPALENSAWSIMAISFISLLAMSAVLATCFFVRRHHIRRERPIIPEVREFHGMSSQLIKAMPSLIFTRVQDDRGTSATCAICLEDYCAGDKLRVLPCSHQFHSLCVDVWLADWRPFCPVCKRDARAGASIPPPSESTPLLAPVQRLPAQSPASGSFRTPTVASPPRPISRHASRHSISIAHSFSGTPRSHNSFGSNGDSPISRSSTELRNSSPSRNHTSYLASSLVNARYASPLIARSGYGSASLLGSLGRQSPQQSQLQQLCGDREANLEAVRSTHSFRQSQLRNRSESEASLSVASAQSLPDV